MVVTNRRSAARGHERAWRWKIGSVFSVVEAETSISDTQSNLENSSASPPQICSYWAVLTSWSIVNPIMICIVHLVLQMLMMCCGSVAN